MPADARVPAISPMTMRFFGLIVRRYFRRHFRSVMAQQVERLESVSGPVVVYLNHSSWWDPMLSMLLAQVLLPRRKHYGAMDAEALKRYPILRKVGVFPVEMASPRGAVEFLRVAEAILRDDGVLWLTPQGRFADAREPLQFKGGLAALARRVPGVTFLPLAVEYTFWDERLPEALARFGEGVGLDASGSAEAITRRLEGALKTEMDELKHASCARDAGKFRVLLAGGRGTGGFYGLVRRLKLTISGKKSDLDHTRRY